MAYDIFIDIDGIPGEAMDAKYKDKIIVRGFSWGAAQTGTFAHGSGGGAGKVDINSLKFSKNSDVASHLLLMHCCTGTHIKQATLILRKAGGEQRDFLKILITDVIVARFDIIGDPDSHDAQPLEEVVLAFSTVKFSYAKQKQDGTMEAFKDTGWSLKENKKIF